jgi:hypothetical protein
VQTITAEYAEGVLKLYADKGNDRPCLISQNRWRTKTHKDTAGQLSVTVGA